MGKKKQQRKLTERMHHNSDTVRFAIGTNVICAFPDYFEDIESDDGFNYERKIVTKLGVVIAQHYSEKYFPRGMYAPYQVLLDDGSTIFVPEDTDLHIRNADKNYKNDADYGLTQNMQRWMILIPNFKYPPQAYLFWQQFMDTHESRLAIWSFKSWTIIKDYQEEFLRSNINVPQARFALGNPVIFRHGRHLWKRGTIIRTNLYIYDNTGERTAFFYYQVQSGYKIICICSDDDNNIVYDNAESSSYNYKVGEHVYVLSKNKWTFCQIVMHAYPTHLEQKNSLTHLPPYAAYQVKFANSLVLDESSSVNATESACRYGFICHDHKCLIRKHKPTETIDLPIKVTTDEQQNIHIQRWHAAYRFIINTYGLEWKIDRHNRLQTALNCVESRKRQILRSTLRNNKSLAHEESLNSPVSASKQDNAVHSPPTTVQLAKRQTNKEASLVRQQQHEASLREKEERRVTEQIQRLHLLQIADAIGR